MRKVKVSQVAAFIDITPGEDATYKRIAKGATDLNISYSATETSETYVDEDSATTTVDGYGVSLDQEQTAFKGEDVFEFVDDIRKNQKIGTDCETTVVLVNLYDSKAEGSYSAQKYNAAISISEFGGKGGESAKIKYKVNLNGDPVQGTVSIANGTIVFTAVTAATV